MGSLPAAAVTPRGSPGVAEDSALVQDPGLTGVGRRLAFAAAGVALVSFLIALVVGVVNGMFLDIDTLNPDLERSVFNWVSSAATMIAAFVCVVQAIAMRQQRVAFAILGFFLTFFAFDDAVGLHEEVGYRLQDWFGLEESSVGLRLWTVAYMPLLVVVAVMCWRSAGSVVDTRARKLIAAGLGCLAFAVALEAMGFTPVGTPLLVVVTEEALELDGWELVAGGLTVVFVTRLMSAASNVGDARAAPLTE